MNAWQNGHFIADCTVNAQQPLIVLYNNTETHSKLVDQRVERLSEVYNIPDAEYIFDRMRGLSMTIDEEMHRGWKREGVDEALESGEVITKEQRIVDYVSTVNDLIKKGIALDELIDTVPSDIRDDVRERLTPKPEQ
ncbi:MAG: hypothetical protein IKP04_06790 [Candidatus Methanomethylophilaceae archaeon]|nr:hypothetical protein [Candidatus Methanomethylophilaceae archaeon]